MGKVLYVDACAGASGDMLAGALLDLGWPIDELRRLAHAMGLTDVGLDVAREERSHISAKRLVVDDSGPQPHRHLRHVMEHLDKLPSDIGKAAAKVFHRLAQAEGKVHGISPEKVHFHEVGAVDAIIDVTAFCAGLAWLGWPRVVCSPLPLGRGFVDCAHGRLPLPAPAVVALLDGVEVTSWPGLEETVTPTGAALLSTLADKFGPMPHMTFEQSGIGCGTRQGDVAPNILRLFTGREKGAFLGDEVVEIVCHIDDQSPEDLPIIIERLMAAGALDVAAAPLVMKKGRLGLQLIVIAKPSMADALAALALEQTSSIGLRLRGTRRMVLQRRVLEVQSQWGSAKVKAAKSGTGWRYHPEADDVARICRETGLAPAAVRSELDRLAQETDSQ